jgi:hypothetical protein
MWLFIERVENSADEFQPRASFSTATQAPRTPPPTPAASPRYKVFQRQLLKRLVFVDRFRSIAVDLAAVNPWSTAYVPRRLIADVAPVRSL